MKIQCDVCNKDEASVFCTADEAALCDGCDHRVHHANEVASKHQRFSLHRPSAKQYPLCDVCLERRAFIFCQQDRAILCKDCDFPIHSANEHTQKHDRFLLSGIKLSAAAATLRSSPHSNSKSQPSAKNPVLVASSNDPLPLSSTAKTCPSTASNPTPPTIDEKSAGVSLISNEGAGFTSSISEYLMETLPGWQVEDFLDSSSVPIGFCQNDDDMLPLLDADIEGNLVSFSTESMGIWVPQAPSSVYSAQMDDQQIEYRETKEATNNQASRSRLRDDTFIVPQISPANIAAKRRRLLW